MEKEKWKSEDEKWTGKEDSSNIRREIVFVVMLQALISAGRQWVQNTGIISCHVRTFFIWGSSHPAYWDLKHA